jgi:hypothetical protein
VITEQDLAEMERMYNRRNVGDMGELPHFVPKLIAEVRRLQRIEIAAIAYRDAEQGYGEAAERNELDSEIAAATSRAARGLYALLDTARRKAGGQ